MLISGGAGVWGATKIDNSFLSHTAAGIIEEQDTNLLKMNLWQVGFSQ